jgi:hypothetical protein
MIFKTKNMFFAAAISLMAASSASAMCMSTSCPPDSSTPASSMFTMNGTGATIGNVASVFESKTGFNDTFKNSQLVVDINGAGLGFCNTADCAENSQSFTGNAFEEGGAATTAAEDRSGETAQVANAGVFGAQLGFQTMGGGINNTILAGANAHFSNEAVVTGTGDNVQNTITSYGVGGAAANAASQDGCVNCLTVDGGASGYAATTTLIESLSNGAQSGHMVSLHNLTNTSVGAVWDRSFATETTD